MEDQAKKKTEKKKTDDEIDLIALVKTIWDGRNTIVKTVVVGTIIGIAIALLSPKEYAASTTLVPQTSGGQSNLGGLSSLASMAGFNLNMSQGVTELSPQVYPQIVQSVPFQLEVINSLYTFPGVEEKISLYTYYTEIHKPGVLSLAKKYTIGLPGVILKALKGEKKVADSRDSLNGTIKLSRDEENVRKIIAENLSLSLNEKEGYLELSSRFFDPELAAQVAQKAKNLLQETITKFKIEKANDQLQFIQERYNEKKQGFEKAQAKLADFRDRNKNVTSAMALTQEEQLQNEYQLAFNVYSELAQQLEQAQIKVKEDTPVFSTIKPVMVPLEKTKPNRLMILLVWIFFGGIIGLGIIFGKHYFREIKNRWKDK